MQTADADQARETRHAGQPALARPNEYLTFRLGSEEYGIDILKVQEIRGYEQPTRIANAPPAIKGVTNLRGVIVPIVDLRVHFGMDSVQYDGFTVVIVLNVGSRVIGVVVDSVSDVVALSPEVIRDAPEMSSTLDAGHILGLAALGERMLILLDIERLMTSPEMAIFE